MSLHLVNIVGTRMGPSTMTSMHVHFEDRKGGRVMVIRCLPSRAAIFAKEGEVERFYIRTGPATTELTGNQSLAYIKERFA